MSAKHSDKLKRRSKDDTSSAKRPRLSKNILQSSAPKEITVEEWLETLNQEELRSLVNWLDGEELTEDLKSQLEQHMGGKASKMDTSKHFTTFLQNEMMRHLKSEGKLDKTMVEIIKISLKLYPDIFPEEYVDVYGKWTTELMFRQNKELLMLLRKDFEEYCLMALEVGVTDPSTMKLTSLLSAILCSFFRHNKMADHTVPQRIAEDFWTAFEQFEHECLGRFGRCILELDHNPQLASAFLNLSTSVACLKLLNMQYSSTKLNMASKHPLEVFDISSVLPCLNGAQWMQLATKVSDDENALLLNNLLLSKVRAIHLSTSSSDEKSELLASMKAHFIKQMSTRPDILEISGFQNVVFSNIDKQQAKQISKYLIKIYQNNLGMEIKSMITNKVLLNAIVLETSKTLAKCFENNDKLAKAMNKSDFDLANHVKEIEVRQYFEDIRLKDDQEDVLNSCLEIFKQIPLAYAEENSQLAGIFILLSTKKCCHKKIRKSIDQILQKVFELSPKSPDLFKIFPVDFLFHLKDKMLINLLTLKIKNANNMLLIKCILETAVKKVKTNSEIVKKLVEILLTAQNKIDDVTSIEYFSNTAFQISCIMLPIIARDKRAITNSAFRSILAGLQEKLHESMLDAFKNVDFSDSSLLNDTIGNPKESMVVSENTTASLNAIGAFSLTLSKYCETSDAVEIKNLDCLWSGLDFFAQHAIKSLQNPSSKTHHTDASMQLLTIILRHIKKLESHRIFERKDEFFVQIWKGLLQRMAIGKTNDDTGVVLKYLSEFTSGEAFAVFLSDLFGLLELKTPSETTQDTIKSHQIAKYFITQILKANIVGTKCVSISKLIARYCKTLRIWLQEHFHQGCNGRVLNLEIVCDLLRIDLDTLSEAVLAAKKVTLDYKFLDSIFALQHLLLYPTNFTLVQPQTANFTQPNSAANITAEQLQSADDFTPAQLSVANFTLLEGSLSVLNSLLVAREELLEDRWPCYMQSYRAVLRRVCELSASAAEPSARNENKLAEIAHSVEKLTQSICKRKTHVTRIAAYAVADICSLLETTIPIKTVRQHLQNCTALFIQSSDSSYTAAFLRRALANRPGHMTLGNMYTMYKRYHKYVGNA